MADLHSLLTIYKKKQAYLLANLPRVSAEVPIWQTQSVTKTKSSTNRIRMISDAAQLQVLSTLQVKRLSVITFTLTISKPRTLQKQFPYM